MSLLSRVVDERFLEHRRRSTSTAGVIVAASSILVFSYRFYVRHWWSWDLLAVGVGFVVIKLALMTFYYLTD